MTHELRHAAVLRTPGGVLGAMLPDFEQMSGSGPTAVTSDSVRVGVQFHHATDRAFHGAEVFIAACAEGRTRLTADGVGRGAARALAHIGLELLLDGFLLEQTKVGDAYANALAWFEPESHIAPTGNEVARLHALRERLLAVGPPRGYTDPDRVVTTLYRILSHRPRLAPDPRVRPAIVAWAQDIHRAHLSTWAPKLLTQTTRRLQEDTAFGADGDVASSAGGE